MSCKDRNHGLDFCGQDKTEFPELKLVLMVKCCGLLESNLCTMVTLGKWLGNHHIQGHQYIQDVSECFHEDLITQTSEQVINGKKLTAMN